VIIALRVRQPEDMASSRFTSSTFATTDASRAREADAQRDLGATLANAGEATVGRR